MKKFLSWTLVPLFCAAAFLVVSHFHHAQKEEEVVFVPHTWSTFIEYPRLEMLFKGFAIESMIDVPSVDILDYQKHDLGIKTYIGVAESPIRARGLQAQFGSAERAFSHFRIDADVLPKADLILCWDTLCTLPQREVNASLLQFKKSGAKFLLMRHYPDVETNVESTNGVFHPINWNNPPYNFPEPMIHIMEEGENGLISLALWSLEQL